MMKSDAAQKKGEKDIFSIADYMTLDVNEVQAAAHELFKPVILERVSRYPLHMHNALNKALRLYNIRIVSK